jgi:hypothetical protein
VQQRKEYMIYKINDTVVLGTAFKIPNNNPVIVDIFDNIVSNAVASDEADKNRNRDATIDGICCQITRNMELGKSILALWREYVIIKSRELGITGQGIAQLEQFYLIECAMLGGMLSEASQMVLTMPTNIVITDDIKDRFSKACVSADHII